MFVKINTQELKETSPIILKVSYCGLKNLLDWFAPIGYTYSNCGKTSDIYLFDNIVLSTGYRPIGNININRIILNKYNIQYNSKKEAQEAINNLIK